MARRQQLRDNEISQIPKGLINANRGELFTDEFPSPPGPDFFELPPVVPADDSFIKPDDLPDVQQTPKKILFKLRLKNLKQILKKKNCLNHWQNLFQISMRFLKKI